MSFYDDSHILSRLGILDSTDESPKRMKNSPVTGTRKVGSPENETFVEVNIDGEVETDSDNEDTLYDKDTLLANGTRFKVLRRQPESFRCRYLLLMLSYFSMGALCHSSMEVSSHNLPVVSHLNHIYQCIGTLAGVFIGRFAIYRINSTIFFTLNMLLVTVVSALLFAIPTKLNIHLTTTIQRTVVGALSYASLSLYFSFWRSNNRKVLWFFALFAFGSAIALVFLAQPAALPEATTAPQKVVKRDVDEIQPFPPESSSSNSTDGNPKRPEVAQGQSMVKSKTDQNQIMREKANPDTLNTTLESGLSPSGKSQENPTTETTTTSTTTTMRPSTTTSTLQPASTGSATRSSRGKDRYRLSIPKVEDYLPNTSAELFVLVVLAISTSFHLLAFVCCCTSCRLGTEPKVLKLRDPSQSGFTNGCKLRLTVFFGLCGFLENFLMMYLSSVNKASLLPWTSFAVRMLAIVPSPSSYSLVVVVLTATVCTISAVCVSLSASVDINLAMLCASCAYLPVCVFLNIESRLTPRPSLLLDYFFLPHAEGHLISAVLCWRQDSPWYIQSITVSVLLLILCLFFLMRSIAKAVRLKEIMEYTSATTQGTLGEYLALVDREHLELSDIDEQDDTDEL